ncbi:MAG: tagaturonate epimerase family protein [Chloroflexota bacterium]|nr:tagaturonate epimerase family protein [Chloroflexota bacterium]
MSELPTLAGFVAYPRSAATIGSATAFLVRDAVSDVKRLALVAEADDPVLNAFDGERSELDGRVLLLCEMTPGNAICLREALSWLRPQPLGLRTSAGCGDRLGLATPGHVRAMRNAPGVMPIYAQQSIRENARTGRSPQEVVDDATWGVFQEGWREGYGADADHLKTTDDADVTVAAGYTFFTVDPGDHVDDEAHTAPLDLLREKYEQLPWETLDSSPDALRSLYLGRSYDLEGLQLAFDEESLLRAAAKYARATVHAARMYRHLDETIVDRTWELEVSVDETATPTSHLEHLYIASELKRLGVRWVSLAPRYVGDFEKGVDYIGDLDIFRTDFAGHAAIARALGPYKLSLHSGSDKFSIYSIANEETHGVVHLKTAGTSYLEALRAIARVEPDLFRAIYELAFLRYDEDRATYHVSAETDRAPRPEVVPDSVLPDVLDQFDAREMLHVTFGSALARYGDQIKAALIANEEAHYAAIETHFDRHLAPFAGRS